MTPHDTHELFLRLHEMRGFREWVDSTLKEVTMNLCHASGEAQMRQLQGQAIQLLQIVEHLDTVARRKT